LISFDQARWKNLLRVNALAALILYLVNPVLAQHKGQPSKDPADGLSDKYTFQQLLDKDPGAVKNAEKFFALSSDTHKKERVASILLSVGVSDAVYFDYLSSEATKSLNVGIPWPTLYDDHGSLVKDRLNPEFLEWCAKRKLEPLSVFNATYYDVPVPWRYLAAAGDPRSYELLINGLHSTNLMIASFSALGLAKLQDPRAVPEIITALRKAPLETRYTIIEALLYFRDSRAQVVVEEFASDKTKLAFYRNKVTRNGIRGIFGY
jgi:hypothetical protein